VIELRDRFGSAAVQGAVVELVGVDWTRRRWLGGGSYQSADPTVACFGLPQAAKGSLAARVRWPGGKTSEHAVERNRRTTIREGKTDVRSEALRR